jgi:hypothetical protein
MFKIFFTLLFPLFVSAKPIKVAVIDTGYSNFIKTEDVSLCEGLHADLTKNKTYMQNPPLDSHEVRHGSNVSWLIQDQVSKENLQHYCIVVIKYFDKKTTNTQLSSRAIEYAIEIGVDIINYSGGGIQEDSQETELVKKALNSGIIFVAAAGNEGKDLSEQPYYPALSDPRVIVVGNKDSDGKIVKSSNFGAVVDVWEIGKDRKAGGVTLTGTSQATAVVTGKIINQIIAKANQGMIQHIKDTVNFKGSKDGRSN